GPVHARVDRLVGEEARHLLQPRRELLVHSVHELVDALRVDAVVVHACLHRSSTSVVLEGSVLRRRKSTVHPVRLSTGFEPVTLASGAGDSAPWASGGASSVLARGLCAPPPAP